MKPLTPTYPRRVTRDALQSGQIRLKAYEIGSNCKQAELEQGACPVTVSQNMQKLDMACLSFLLVSKNQKFR